MTLEPRRVDTEVLTEQTDFADLARQAMNGSVGGSTRADCFPLDWIFRAYRELAGSPYADLLSRGVAGCLDPADPWVCAQAMVFFGSEPAAAGAERIVGLDRDRYVGVPDPLSPGRDLAARLDDLLRSRRHRSGCGS